MKDCPEQRFLTIREAVVFCGLSDKSIRRLIGLKQLSAHRPLRGRILIDREDLMKLIKASKEN